MCVCVCLYVYECALLERWVYVLCYVSCWSFFLHKMAPSHVFRISRNQAEPAGMKNILYFELYSGGNFKIAGAVRMPLEYKE